MYSSCLSVSGLFHNALHSIYFLADVRISLSDVAECHSVSFVHSSVDKQLGCCHILAVVGGTLVNMGAQVADSISQKWVTSSMI